MKFALIDFGIGKEYWFSILRVQLDSWLHSKSLFRLGTEEFLTAKLTHVSLPEDLIGRWKRRFVVELCGIRVISKELQEEKSDGKMARTK